MTEKKEDPARAALAELQAAVEFAAKWGRSDHSEMSWRLLTAMQAYMAALAQPAGASAQQAEFTDDQLVALGRHEVSGIPPWGIGTERSDYLRAVRAVLATAQQADEMGWLIEMQFGDGLLYWSGAFESAGHWSDLRLVAKMVKDAGQALRFARREDGQRALDGLLAARPCPLLHNAAELYSVQEHAWPTAQQAEQASDAQDAARWRYVRDKAEEEIHFDHTTHGSDGGHRITVSIPFDGDYIPFESEGPTLEAAVDAALTKDQA